MKVTARLLAVLLATVMTLHAERFFLIDESGTEHGPYDLTHERTLTLAGQTYRIRVPRIEHREHEIFQMMQKCRIPEVDFRQADIRDVVDFLVKASVEFWPDDGTPQRGISVIMRLEDDMRPGDDAPSRSGDHIDPFADDPFGTPHGRHKSQTLITFSALDVTLYEIYEIVCELAGLEMKVRGSKLMLIPAQQPPESPADFSRPRL